MLRTAQSRVPEREGRLFLVAVPQGRVLLQAARLQRMLARRYRLYKRLPPLHMTIEVIRPPSDRSFAEAVRTIRAVVERTPPFQIHTDGFVCFPAPHKALAVSVVKTPELERLSKRLHLQLGAAGFGVRDDLDEWEFHITLAGTWNSLREWSDLEFQSACNRLRRRGFQGRCLVTRLELWRPRFDPKLDVAARFHLPEQPVGSVHP